MSNRKSIMGTVRYLDFEGGFWGIEGENGRKYAPVNMPEQLKSKNAKVNLVIEVLKDAFSLSMWGEPVRIVGFETIREV